MEASEVQTLVKEMDSRFNIVRGCAKQTETAETKSDGADEQDMNLQTGKQKHRDSGG